MSSSLLPNDNTFTSCFMQEPDACGAPRVGRGLLDSWHNPPCKLASFSFLQLSAHHMSADVRDCLHLLPLFLARLAY